MERLSVSNSRMNTFWDCEQKYYWNYVRSLVTTQRQTYFDEGSLYHKGVSTYLHPMNMAMDEKEKQQLAIDDMIRMGTEQGVDDEILRNVSRWTKTFFRHPSVESFVEEYNILTVEQWTETKLFDVNGIDVYAMAKSDAIAQHKHNKQIWVIEHKTAKSLSSSGERRFTDGTQVSQYAYVLKDLLRKPIFGVIFFIMLKQKTPKLREIPAIIDDNKLVRWSTAAYDTVCRMLDIHHEDCRPIQNLSACNTYMGECRYKPLCVFGENDTTLSLYKLKDETKTEDGGIKR